MSPKKKNLYELSIIKGVGKMHEVCAMVLTKVVWFLFLKFFMGPVLFSVRF